MMQLLSGLFNWLNSGFSFHRISHKISMNGKKDDLKKKKKIHIHKFIEKYHHSSWAQNPNFQACISVIN